MEQSCYYEQSIKYNFCSSWILEYILHLHCYFFVIKDCQTLDNFLIKTRQRLEWITDLCIPGSLSWATITDVANGTDELKFCRYTLVFTSMWAAWSSHYLFTNNFYKANWKKYSGTQTFI